MVRIIPTSQCCSPLDGLLEDRKKKSRAGISQMKRMFASEGHSQHLAFDHVLLVDGSTSPTLVHHHRHHHHLRTVGRCYRFQEEDLLSRRVRGRGGGGGGGRRMMNKRCQKREEGGGVWPFCVSLHPPPPLHPPPSGTRRRFLFLFWGKRISHVWQVRGRRRTKTEAEKAGKQSLKRNNHRRKEKVRCKPDL